MNQRKKSVYERHTVQVHGGNEQEEQEQSLIAYEPRTEDAKRIPFADEEDFTIERKLSLVERRNVDLSILIKVDEKRNENIVEDNKVDNSAGLIIKVENVNPRNLRRNSISMPSGINALELEAIRMAGVSRPNQETVHEEDYKTTGDSITVNEQFFPASVWKN